MGTSELDVLKAVLASNNRYAGWCTITVFVGLLIEYTILFWLERKKISCWERVLTIVAGMAIAGGVGGEYLFGSRASSAALKLESISEGRIAESEERTAKAELAEKELEAIIQPRDLASAEQIEIKRELSGFSGRVVSVRSYALDTESKRLGKIIEEVLRASGLQVSDNLGNLFNLAGNVVEGIQIAGPHSQDDLIKALLGSPLGSDEKLGMFRKEDPRIPENALVEILIGFKPITTINGISQKAH